MHTSKSTKELDEKVIEELEKIFNDFSQKMNILKFEQEKIVQEYIAKLAEKKKETLLRDSSK